MKKQIIAVLIMLAIPWELHHGSPDLSMNGSSNDARPVRAAWFFRSNISPPTHSLADLRLPSELLVPLKRERGSPLLKYTVGGYKETAPVPPSDSTGIPENVFGCYFARLP